MDRKKRSIAYFIVLFLVLTILLSGVLYFTFFRKPDTDNTVSDIETGPVQLGEVEVSNYNGTKLGSKEDFRENSIFGPQYFDMNTYRFNVTGLVEQERSYSYDELLENNTKYRKIVTLNCVEGWNVKILWDGLMVRDIIEEAGPLDSGKVLIFKAADGYTTSLPIEFFYENDVLIAYGMNNVTLDPERGFPFQLVAEMKWGYKWIKWITEIEISDDIDYHGYWEERGYNNNGDLSGPIGETMI